MIYILILARFTLFKTTDKRSLVGSFYYDPVVALTIAVTTYSYIASNYNSYTPRIIPLALYLCASSLFFWALKTTRELIFALSRSQEKLVTTGAFLFVRHPYYTSYILTWTASPLVYSSPLLWATLFYLTGFYLYSARQEETSFLQGKHSNDYPLMFVPDKLKREHAFFRNSEYEMIEINALWLGPRFKTPQMQLRFWTSLIMNIFFCRKKYLLLLSNTKNKTILYEGPPQLAGAQFTHQSIRVGYTTRWSILLHFPRYIREICDRKRRSKTQHARKQRML